MIRNISMKDYFNYISYIYRTFKASYRVFFLTSSIFKYTINTIYDNDDYYGIILASYNIAKCLYYDMSDMDIDEQHSLRDVINMHHTIMESFDGKVMFITPFDILCHIQKVDTSISNTDFNRIIHMLTVIEMSRESWRYSPYIITACVILMLKLTKEKKDVTYIYKNGNKEYLFWCSDNDLTNSDNLMVTIHHIYVLMKQVYSRIKSKALLLRICHVKHILESFSFDDNILEHEPKYRNIVKHSITKYNNNECDMYSDSKRISNGIYGKIYKISVDSESLIIKRQKTNDISEVTREICIMKTLTHYNIGYIRHFKIEKRLSLFSMDLHYASLDTMIFHNVEKVAEIDDPNIWKEAYDMRISYRYNDVCLLRDIARQIMSAMDYIHSYGIIHCDIKPNNILLTEDNIVKIIDFGISKPYVCGVIRDTMICSLPYRAYDIIEKEVDFKTVTYTNKADVWSVGILLVEMETGVPMLYRYSRPSSSLLNAITRIVKEDMLNIVPNMRLRNMLLRMLDFNPDTRISFKEALNMI